MSKKKGGVNTMTLKDFHGGSIPSDLALPSAPGVTVRSSDRTVYDRPSSRGNPISRSDHRSWPHNSSVTKNYDDKTPFLTHTAPIGRNFDEDERKPLDGISVARRTISGESVRAPPSRVELKPEYGLGGSSLSQKVTAVSQTQVGTVNSYSSRLTEAIHVGVNSQNLRDSREQGTSGVSPNVWATRKNVENTVEPDQYAWSGPNAFSKLAHASAVDKVSSGRWQSKTSHGQTDVESGRSSEVESRSHFNVSGNNTYNRRDTAGEKEYSDVMLARHAERSLTIDDQRHRGRNELLEYERFAVSKYSDVQSRLDHTDGVQLALNDGKVGGPGLHRSVASEPIERPKLKLLPRTKPVENSESSVSDFVQGYRGGSDSSHVESVNEANVHANFVKSDSAGTESSKEVGQRPKLNLKPRSQAIEQLEGNTKKDRNALFGGARPRELVLKERGVDDVAINSYDVVEHTNRVEYNTGRAEKLPDRSIQTHYGQKSEDALSNPRTGKKPERRDQWADAERVHAQRRNWRGDDRRNTRLTDRQQVSERQPSPEMWRKPVEEPKSSDDTTGMRHGKAASAVELAQTFSRSVSDPKMNDRFVSQRGLNTGQAQQQQPFSRLVGSSPRPQINGY
ncbi:uncharacterized protein G2W53_041873 [Senna tora]|uniref:Uncharacterized protein n=1 Tax=Senna tora TaxID=362788 RepID=A0A834VZ39_9FABA|nr:uncharacterized protein G2W53_041873 [Senna tora]